jgi:hypothetical protein
VVTETVEYFSYEDSPYPVRADIAEAHREYWRRLAQPGSWWTGADRIAIAAELRASRTCNFCKKRKQALSPYTDELDHEVTTDLPAIVVDAIHRIMTDQNRITRSWVESNVDSGLGEEAYVELTGIVVAVISIDEFNRGLGLDFEPLPEPEPGEPDGYRPPNLVRDTGFVPMLGKGSAKGQEADLWPGAFTANVLRALTLVPDALRDWKMLAGAQYLSMEDMGNFVGKDDRAIDRAQMEIVAGRVSSYNECFY